MNNESFGNADIIKLEKILLAKKVGLFLGNRSSVHERQAVENVARLLSKDTNISVREVLAYELRYCDVIPGDVVERIVSDVADVAGPFLRDTNYFEDKELADLVPTVEERVRSYIAERLDLGAITQNSIVETGGENSVSSLLDNYTVSLPKEVYNKVISRFGTNINLMDHMGLRPDLTKDLVHEIAGKVSKKCKQHFFIEYGIEINPTDIPLSSPNIQTLLSKIQGASAAQVHAFVADLRSQRNLSHGLVLEMSEHGCLSFLESSLALLAGLPISQVQDMLSLKNSKSFVKLMSMANVEQVLAPRYLKVAKRYYGDQGSLAA